MADLETGATLNGEVHKPNPNYLSIYTLLRWLTFKNILRVERPSADTYTKTQFKRP